MKHWSSGLKRTASLCLLAASLTPARNTFVNAIFHPHFLRFSRNKTGMFYCAFRRLLSTFSYNMIITIIPYCPV